MLRSEVESVVSSLLPDNFGREITPADLRDSLAKLIDYTESRTSVGIPASINNPISFLADSLQDALAQVKTYLTNRPDTFENGLSKNTAGAAELGGALTKGTTITLGTKYLNLAYSSGSVTFQAGEIFNNAVGGKMYNGSAAGGNNYMYSQSAGGKIGFWAGNNTYLAATGDILINTYTDFAGGAGSTRMIVKGGGNVLIGKLTDNGLGNIQTTSIAIDAGNWNYSNDGVARLFYGPNSGTYFRVNAGNAFNFRFDVTDAIMAYQDNFMFKTNGLHDISEIPVTTTSATVRQFVFRREANLVDYRFFDWNGTDARDWWNVYTQTQLLKLGQMISVKYGVNVGIGTDTPNASALLELTSTNKGFLAPRMTTTQRNAISSPATGLIVFNSSTNKINFYNGSSWEAVTSV